ncbi:rhox homeobox family member 2-like [Psammomys obesus]|uniref:rhox homeobox family member 2-like n=1 Tax=Psammomys obesus TaxID=48139 RepID=UPI002452F132|nr:rhox homeobox family member 2-like [Psammomys obesus]
METRQGCCLSFRRLLGLGPNEDQEQQIDENAVVVSEAGEEGGKQGVVQGEFSQGELDQGKLAQGEFAQGKVAQEDLTQLSPTLEVTGVVKEGENKEEMEEEYARIGASSSMDKIHPIEVPSSSDQPQPQQEAAMPEGTNSLLTGDRQPPRRRPRFTLSQLQDLERLFHETRYPSLRARKDLARWMGVSEADVQDWFRTRRSIFRRNNRLVTFYSMPPGPQNNAS